MKELKEIKDDRIRILSNRKGDVGCPDGTMVLYQQVTIVSPETAEWLLKSFPLFMKKVD